MSSVTIRCIGELFRWLWPKIVQDCLNGFVEYWNCKKTETQYDKILPSAAAPNIIFDFSERHGLQYVGQPVLNSAVEQLRSQLPSITA
ncbi:hypothetical protein IW261DRAFT_41184 [Armillaria novae-zelandiae]|uniref:Uncharacterized protein n=1 Tax=Armillaria novae-zelandiae TaxID=153914 RepID=A0AA39PVA1_9AGAR|nr:hypothetical protein IW261DRAFT_41184 [Armillaria novae-zelandiae]